MPLTVSDENAFVCGRELGAIARYERKIRGAAAGERYGLGATFVCQIIQNATMATAVGSRAPRNRPSGLIPLSPNADVGRIRRVGNR